MLSALHVTPSPVFIITEFISFSSAESFFCFSCLLSFSFFAYFRRAAAAVTATPLTILILTFVFDVVAISYFLVCSMPEVVRRRLCDIFIVHPPLFRHI